jgi:hypothetical protein
MPETRTFRIVVVGEHHGAGGELTPEADKVVQYDGKSVIVTP